MKLYYSYLGPEILSGFDAYKYSSKDTSPLSNYVMHPFWNQTVKLCPRWVAPNLLTFVGFLFCFGHFGLLALYDYDYTAATSPAQNQIPGWIWILVAVFLFLYHTLDGIDGKQARRTGTSTPLGELFDHGLDSWTTIFITGAIYSMFGRNDDGLSLPLFRMFLLFWNVYVCFLVSHWEKYNTGVLYLPWGYDFSMITSFLMYLVTAFSGTELWKQNIVGGLYPAHLLEVGCYAGNLGFSLPVALYNIRKANREGTGKNRSFMEAMRPLVSTLAAMTIFLIWVLMSQNDILELDPRCMFFLTGTVFSNICCKLIIAQMANTRSELFSAILAPTFITIVAVLVIPMTATAELYTMYFLTGVVTLAQIHYGSCVVLEMCDHFRIRPFHISSGYAPVPTSNEDTQDLLAADHENTVKGEKNGGFTRKKEE